MLETAWESRWLPGSLKKGAAGCWQKEGCTLKTAHRKVIIDNDIRFLKNEQCGMKTALCRRELAHGSTRNGFMT